KCSALPADNLIEYGDQHGERDAAQDAAFGDLVYIFGFGNRDGEAVAQVHVQHDVQIGAAVAGINDVIRADLEIALQLVECGDLAVTGGGAHDGLDVPAVAVAKLGAKNVVERNHTLHGGQDHLVGSSREHVKVEKDDVTPLSKDLI